MGLGSRAPRIAAFGAPLLAGLLAAALFWPAGSFEFLSLDDFGQIADNPAIAYGLGTRGLAWAIFPPPEFLWHPLTWLSFMADYEIWGLDAGGFHRTNVLLFAVDTALLSVLFCRLTGSRWAGFLASALWAAHPMRVESVAWTIQRKDLLCGLFFLLALLCYERYARTGRKRAYWGSVVAMALGFSAKAIVVTFPLIAILLDTWPLGRFSIRKGSSPSPWDLIREKLPYAAVAAAGSAYTFARMADAMLPATTAERAARSLFAHAFLLKTTFFPTDLALFDRHYQLPVVAPPGVVLFGVAFLGVTVLLARLWRRWPFALAGWLWFLAALAPVNGFFATGNVVWSDKYTFLPHMGFALAVGGGLVAAGGRARRLLAVAVVTIVLVLARLSREYLPAWKDSETLFSHVISVRGENAYSYFHLGNDRAQRDDLEGAMRLYDRALETDPGYGATYVVRAIAASELGLYGQAIRDFTTALAAKPQEYRARYGLGKALVRAGDLRRASEEALRLEQQVAPGGSATEMALLRADLWLRVGIAAAERGDLEGAIAFFDRAAASDGANAEVYYSRAVAKSAAGRTGEAIEDYRRALAISPDDHMALFNLGVILFDTGNFVGARSAFQRLLKLRPGSAAARNYLERIQKGPPSP